MKLYLSILSIAFVVCSTQACQGGNCKKFCAAEKMDPTNELTFSSKSALKKFNEHFDKDAETFAFKHKGKCVPPKECPKTKKTSICALPKIGACGTPKTFANFCELNKYNTENPTAEFEYYHDKTCNEVATATVDDSTSLECDKEASKPVCAIPEAPCGRPVTFNNYCWLQKFNCEVPKYQFWYFHEGACYTDEVAK